MFELDAIDDTLDGPDTLDGLEPIHALPDEALGPPRDPDDRDDVALDPPEPPAALELEWFFTMAESDMGLRSNFAVLVGTADDLSMDDRAEAAHANRTIGRWMRALGEHDAGVLYAAFAARPWSLGLRKALRRLTGVVVRLASVKACADHGADLPDDEDERLALDVRTGERLTAEFMGREASDRDALRALRGKAQILFDRAFARYERARGGAQKPVLAGVSTGPASAGER